MVIVFSFRLKLENHTLMLELFSDVPVTLQR